MKTPPELQRVLLLISIPPKSAKAKMIVWLYCVRINTYEFFINFNKKRKKYSSLQNFYNKNNR